LPTGFEGSGEPGHAVHDDGFHVAEETEQVGQRAKSAQLQDDWLRIKSLV
jgi:hypothetical protein